MVDWLIRPEARVFLDHPSRMELIRRLREALRLLHRRTASVSLLLTTDPEIRQLNRDYRRIDRATDVLSFHQQDLKDETDLAGQGAYLGDIVISLETALRRSGKGRLQGELARLAIHGLCHLFGHDHHRPVPARRMRALEQRLLRGSRKKRRS
jgi:probable rRNA maturation factor